MTADGQVHFRPTLSEAERHSVAVRSAVRIGEIHCGAMGKPSGINTFESEESIASQA